MGQAAAGMSLWFAVAAGGALGALARWLTVVQMARLLGVDFPAGTMIVNVLGSLAMGLVAALLAQGLSLSAELRTFLTVGFLGGFTTFSAYTLDAVGLADRGEWAAAAFYTAGSVALGVLAFLAGARLARVLL